jgi:hypothetical protein
MKKILLLFAFLVFLTSVGAWENGQRFTQQQLDDLNADSLKVQCQSYSSKIDYSNQFIGFYRTCPNITKDTNSLPYLVYDEERYLSGASFGQLVFFMQNYGLQETVDYFLTSRNAAYVDFLQEIRNRLKGYQTNSELQNLLNVLSGLKK